MQHEIKTIKDVESFLEQIAGEINDFHPLEDFSDYVFPESYFRRYTEEEAEIRNKRLEKCFDVCAKVTTDYFTLLIRIYQQESSKVLSSIQ